MKHKKMILQNNTNETINQNTNSIYKTNSQKQITNIISEEKDLYF